jgi:hypothetical protein
MHACQTIGATIYDFFSDHFFLPLTFAAGFAPAAFFYLPHPHLHPQPFLHLQGLPAVQPHFLQVHFVPQLQLAISNSFSLLLDKYLVDYTPIGYIVSIEKNPRIARIF